MKGGRPQSCGDQAASSPFLPRPHLIQQLCLLNRNSSVDRILTQKHPETQTLIAAAVGGGKWNESRMKFWDDAAAADMIPNLWFYQLVNVFFFFFFCLRFWNSLFSRPKYLSGFSSSSSSSSLVWDGLIKWNVVLLPRSAIFLQNWQNVKKASPFIKCANGFSDSECPKNARGLLISGRRERASSAKVFTLMVISFFSGISSIPR